MKVSNWPLLFCLLLAACAKPEDETALDARAYLPAALSEPMPVLYDKAMAGQAEDWARLGLALAAGRPSPAIISEADQTRLAVVDARLQAAKREWLKENSLDSLDKVPWDYQINLSQDDITLVWRVNRQISADYWLSRADDATVLRTVSTVSATRFGGAIPSYTYTQMPAINDNSLLSAVACAVAVRKGAGLTAHATPEVLRRLRDHNVHEMEAELAHRNIGTVGPAACGKTGAFARYVALLRSTA